jgi:hypothetical protein
MSGQWTGIVLLRSCRPPAHMSCYHLMCRLLHVSHAHDIGLVMWHLGRYAHAPMGDHDGNATVGYLFNPQPVELHRTCDGSGAALSQEARVGAMVHMVAPELPCTRRWELTPWAASQHSSCPSRDSGAGATGPAIAPELPRAKRRELAPQEVWRHLSCPCRVT